MPRNITELTKKNFDSFTTEGKVVVDFWAEWCGPCRIMGPIFDEAAHELKGEVKFGKVNVDENYELAQRFDVLSIPTTIIFNKGKQIDRFVGVIEKEELVEKLE